MTDYFVRYTELPWTIRGVTVPNADTTFDIYINSRLPEETQRKTLEHELKHIDCEHFYVDLPIETIENQADGEPITGPVFDRSDGKIPLFTSPQALADWIATVCKQKHIDLYNL